MSTAKERQAKRRAKIRADSELHQEQLLRDRERKKCQCKAQKEKISEHQLEEHWLKERLRIKAYRSKQSMKPTSSTASTTDLGTPYRSRQAPGKAMKRLEHSVPSSPRKQHFVVGKLARSVGILVSSSSKKSISAESEAKRELVHTFYRTDDVSWQAPGKKDCIIIREATEAGERIKQTQQVRYMIMSLREAWNKFKEQHSTPKMCLSKFCELRPPNVKLFDQLPHKYAFAATMRMFDFCLLV